jgi:DeoR family glycerol-3-phosphate regulon repressor
MEVDLTRDILTQSRQVVLVAHEGKFERKAPHVVTHLRDVDVLVTNGEPAAHFEDPGVLQGLRLVLA